MSASVGLQPGQTAWQSSDRPTLPALVISRTNGSAANPQTAAVARCSPAAATPVRVPPGRHRPIPHRAVRRRASATKQGQLTLPWNGASPALVARGAQRHDLPQPPVSWYPTSYAAGADERPRTRSADDGTPPHAAEFNGRWRSGVWRTGIRERGDIYGPSPRAAGRRGSNLGSANGSHVWHG